MLVWRNLKGALGGHTPAVQTKHTQACQPSSLVVPSCQAPLGHPPDEDERQVDGRKEGERVAVVSHLLHSPAVRHSGGDSPGHSHNWKRSSSTDTSRPQRI